MKIVFRDRPPGPEVIAELRQTFPDVDIRDGTDDAAFARDIGDADAVVGGRWTESLLAKAGKLAWLQSIYAGVDDLPLDAFVARGVAVTNFRGVSAVSISEHVLALMFAFARGLPSLFDRQKNGVWLPQAQRPTLFELTGQRVGILGYGALGSAVAQACHRNGMRVVTCYRTERSFPDFVECAYPLSEIEAMLGSVDHLVLVLPSTPDTRGLMNRSRLFAMKKGAYLYNVGRGDAVDSDALVAALTEGHLGGAGLDVTDPEPLPSDSALWKLGNVIITGHTAGMSPRRWERGMEIIVENIRRFRAGEVLLNRVG